MLGNDALSSSIYEDHGPSMVEFDTTIHALNKYIKPYYNLLDVGASPYFWGSDSGAIESMLQAAGFKIMDHIATDGVTPKIGAFINKLDEHEYKAWLDFHLITCRTKAIIPWMF